MAKQAVLLLVDFSAWLVAAEDQQALNCYAAGWVLRLEAPLAEAAASGTEMAYTVDLVGGGTVRVVMDSGNFHAGDCVSVERGKTNNMRRVSNEFCVHNEQVPEEYKAVHKKEANECASSQARATRGEG